MSNPSTPIAIPERDHSAADALGLWEPKRTLTLEAARRHTYRIQLLRKGLVGLAALLLGVLIIQFFESGTSTFDNPNPTESVKMVGPRYSGRTSDGLPFYLTAATATRTMDKSNEVALENPILEFVRAEGAASSFIMSNNGLYDDLNKVLTLKQDVNLETDDGYVCNSTESRIFARDKRIDGSQPIDCLGNFGSVKGQAYEINNNYTEFVFKNGVEALINGSSADNKPVASDGGMFGFSGDGPINIEAERAIYIGGTTDLAGNVTVEQDGATLKSDDMTILRAEADPAADGSIRLGEINKIIANGNFHYFTAENDVKGDQGIYERDKNLITVIGNVKVRQPDGSMASTERLTYSTLTETLLFSGKCQGRNCPGGRNRIVISGG